MFKLATKDFVQSVVFDDNESPETPVVILDELAIMDAAGDAFDKYINDESSDQLGQPQTEDGKQRVLLRPKQTFSVGELFPSMIFLSQKLSQTSTTLIL